MRPGRLPAVLSLAVGLLLLAGDPVAALQGAAPSLRPYWHVFIAYAIAWALVMGWAVSIARRIGRVERRVGGGKEGTGR